MWGKNALLTDKDNFQRPKDRNILKTKKFLDLINHKHKIYSAKHVLHTQDVMDFTTCGIYPGAWNKFVD